MNKEKSIFKSWPFWTLMAIIVAWSSTFFLYKIGLTRKEQGLFGDMFGAVNALFSGFAFWGLIITIRQQKKEIDEQKKEESKLRTQQFFLDQFKIIREDITGFAYIDRRGGAQFRIRDITTSDDATYIEIKGAEAFQKIIESFFKAPDMETIFNSSKFKELFATLMAIDYLIIQVHNSILEDAEKLNIKILIEYTIQAKISPAFDYLIQRLSKEEKYKIIIPEELITSYNSIKARLRQGRSLIFDSTD